MTRRRDLENVKQCSHMNPIGQQQSLSVPHPDPQGRLDKVLS